MSTLLREVSRESIKNYSVEFSKKHKPTKALLSIKPEFASLIFDGTKKFEYRRVIFKQHVDFVVVYASAPLSVVIGEFAVEQILYEDLNTLWHLTRQNSGISRKYFFDYFVNKKRGYAIKIGNTLQYEVPALLKESYGVTPPQSFLYL
jgi:predicted transcriptional regulator